MMEKIKTIEELDEAIQILEIKHKLAEKLLKEQLKSTVENLKPVNLIKSTLRNLTTSPSLKDNLLDTTISLLAGFLSKKIIVGNTHNPIKQILGTVLQMGVTNAVSRNTSDIKSSVLNIIKNFITKK